MLLFETFWFTCVYVKRIYDVHTFTRLKLFMNWLKYVTSSTIPSKFFLILCLLRLYCVSSYLFPLFTLHSVLSLLPPSWRSITIVFLTAHSHRLRQGFPTHSRITSLYTFFRKVRLNGLIYSSPPLHSPWKLLTIYSSNQTRVLHTSFFSSYWHPS